MHLALQFLDKTKKPLGSRLVEKKARTRVLAFSVLDRYYIQVVRFLKLEWERNSVRSLRREPFAVPFPLRQPVEPHQRQRTGD